MNLKGYASTQLPVPIKVQSLVIKDYCEKHPHVYFMSDTEFTSGWHVLAGIDAGAFDGICAYSMACFPLDETLRESVLKPWKEVHFALEGYVLPRDAEKLQTLWRLKSALKE